MSLSRSDQARLNGAKSRGPKSPEGKARSALNALKHGRYATNAIVLKNEDPEAFEELVAGYIRRIQPADPVEYSLTRELAAIDWLLVRVYALDTRLLDHEMEIQAPALDSAGLAIPELTRVLNASRSIVDHSKLPAFLARREAQLVRARHSILGNLKDLRKNFPPCDPAPEVVPPQSLNPESPVSIEPETNPTCESGSGSGSGADPQVCAGPPGPATNKTSATSDSDAASQVRAERSSASESAPDNDAPGPASEQTAPEPANTLPIDSGVEPGGHAPNLKSGKSVPCVPSTEAVPGSSSDPLEHLGAEPGSSNRPGTTGGRPGGRAPRLKTPWGSAPPIPKAA